MVDSARGESIRACQSSGQSAWAAFLGLRSSTGARDCQEPRPLEEANSNDVWTGEFSTQRGGTVVFTLSPHAPFSIALILSGKSRQEAPQIAVKVSQHMAELVLHRGPGQGCKVLARNQLRKAGYSPGKSEAFWLSLNPDDGCIKYGKGSRMMERTFLQFSLHAEGRKLSVSDRAAAAAFFDMDAKQILLQGYSGPQVVETTIYEAPLMEPRVAAACRVSFEESPVGPDPSPRLLDNRQMLLSDFAQEDFSFPANLPPTLQTLSEKVLQPWLSLEGITDDRKNTLGDAIGHSLETPGLFLHNLVQEKMSSLPPGTDKTSVQLSISLGPCEGASPGPPVTLEILPAGHCSSPHDNARACGVLRVLHGQMDVLLFDEDLAEADEALPLDEVEMERGDAFWFSPTWYQTHAMRNVGGSFCCYLMARQYSKEDTVRWPYLKSKASSGSLSHQRVAPDLGFKEMHASVMAELSGALQASSKSVSGDLDLGRTASMRTQDWVDRTDSAMDYTALFKEEKQAPKAHRLSCGVFRRGNLQPVRHSNHLFPPLEVPDASCDLSTVWP